MKTSNVIAGIVLMIWALGFQPGQFVSAATQPEHAAQTDCDGVFRELAQAENWLERLIDPVLDTRTQIDERLQLYLQVHACIPADTGDANLKSIRMLTEYFMDFAGGYQTSADGSMSYLVNLATSDDPAVAEIRQKVGIAPPPGVVYVRLYTSRDAMPNLVKAAFESPDVRGVTIFTRYVAVLAEASALNLKTLPKTVSHELVHAYMKSEQGVRKMDVFPLWYDEGMAVYFSGSSQPSCIYTNNGEVSGTSCETSPENYLQYAANFEYLESKVGQEKTYQLIKYSFDKMDPSILYQAAGFDTYADYSVRARSWKKWQDFIPTAEIGGACLAPFVIFLIIWFWRQVQEGSEERKRNLAYSNRPYQQPPYQGS